MSDNWKVVIVHDDDGHFHIGEYRYENIHPSCEEVEPFIFQETMSYTGYRRGESTIRFYFKSSQGNKYNMSLSEFDLLLQEAGSVKDVAGMWGFKKQGSKVSLHYIPKGVNYEL